MDLPVVVPLESLQMFFLSDLSVPLRYCTCRSVQGFGRLMGLLLGDAFGFPKVQGFLCESKHLLPLLFLNLFVKQREELVVTREDWMRQAIH